MDTDLAALPPADVYRAIADPTRRAIMQRLRGGPLVVHKLAASFRQSRPAISKHLRVLRQAALVAEEKRGRERAYRLTPAPLDEAWRWIGEYREFWQASLAGLKTLLENER